MGRRSKDRRPEGVILKKGRWYYRPTSQVERAERARKKLPETIPLGEAGSEAARIRWAQVTGRRATGGVTGRVEELLKAWITPGEMGKPAPVTLKANGKPRAEGTIKQYTWCVNQVLMPRFGGLRYGKTAIDAARGEAIGTVDVQAFIAEVGTTSANHAVSCLSSVFMWAKRTGRTTYNPCEGAAKIAQEGRTREPQAWEVECLGAMAEHLGRKRMALMLDFEAISGWALVDMRSLQRRQLKAEGVKMSRRKTGARMLLEWSPDLRRIITEALELPGAQRAGVFPLSYVFAARDGGQLSGGAFWDAFRLLLRQTNEALAGCEIPLSIEDLGFHDLRSKAGDDYVEETGGEMHEFLGNTAAVANKHYARRERKVVPLKLKR